MRLETSELGIYFVRKFKSNCNLLFVCNNNNCTHVTSIDTDVFKNCVSKAKGSDFCIKS
jgi:hypothetical protein